ncbi:MAG: alanine--glyoxylate aminotransferase family protein [Spirochaetia bacterium]|nr:alanine--glyoxylate aminotransferase family protein [Spirochaetia bacterium]
MRKKYLLAPGPVQAPPEVLAELAKPLIHHRTEQFENIFFQTQSLLKELFMTKLPVITFAASGTGAMEAAVVNFHSEADEVLVIRGGKFGERWGNISEAYKLKVHYIDIKWGSGIKPEEIEKYLNINKNIKSVMIQYVETSTAAMYDIENIAKVVTKTNTLLIVDAISALGVVPLPADDWKIDVIVGGSQKSLMLPPGLSFLWCSQKALSVSEKSNLPKFYFNIKKELKALEKKTTAWTPAISLIGALNTSLTMMKSYGWENLFKKNKKLMTAIHNGLKALNIELFSSSPAVSVTAGAVPQNVDGVKLVKDMKDIHAVTIAGGQDELKGKIFRVGTLGYVDSSDIIVFFAALEACLKSQNYKFNLGAGLSAAEKVLYSEENNA